jgi:hypothetical protein
MVALETLDTEGILLACSRSLCNRLWDTASWDLVQRDNLSSLRLIARHLVCNVVDNTEIKIANTDRMME